MADSDGDLLARLTKLEMLFRRAGSRGERAAAKAAIDRIRNRMGWRAEHEPLERAVRERRAREESEWRDKETSARWEAEQVRREAERVSEAQRCQRRDRKQSLVEIGIIASFVSIALMGIGGQLQLVAARATEEAQPAALPNIFRIAAAVDTSLVASALRLGATEREVAALAEIFSHEVDLQRDVHTGDKFELVFERYSDDEGNTVRARDLLFVALESRRGLRAYYFFMPPGAARPDWYDIEGKSTGKDRALSGSALELFQVERARIDAVREMCVENALRGYRVVAVDGTPVGCNF